MSIQRILIAYDDVTLAHRTRNVLEEAMYLVAAIASSVRKTLNMVETCQPDLVLMDIASPEAANSVASARDITYKFDVPVLCLAEKSVLEGLDQTPGSDSVVYLQKPYHDGELLTSVRTALRCFSVFRRRVDEVRKESNEHFERVFYSAPIGKAVLGIDGRLHKVNKAFSELTGSSEGELISKRFQDIFVADSRKTGVDPLRQILVGEKRIFQTEGRCYHRLGHELCVLLNFSTMSYHKSTQRYIILQVIDITTWKQAEESLQASEQRYRKLVEATTSYIYTVKVKNGKPLSTVHEPGCVFVTGYTAEEFETNPNLWFQMICEEHRDEVVKQANMILAGEMVTPLEHRIFHKNGSICWVRNTPVPHYDEKGRLTSYDGLITNITEAQKLKDQLYQAQKMEAVGQLAGGIAHDFNNILTAIIGYGTILKLRLSEINLVQSEVDQILNSAERAAKLVERLLAFSRKQPIKPIKMKADKIVCGVEKLLARLIGEDIELKCLYSEAETTIIADKWQLEQVLINLATNARDAMPHGGTLTIETGVTTLNAEFVKTHGYGELGRYYFIKVTDTGTGMNEETQRRIFDPFFTTKEMGRGTGLGLAIVYGIVKQHKGYITVASELGIGTIITVHLPVDESGIADEKSTESIAPMKGVETVLLAEDDENVRYATRMLLESLGYSVFEAIDGEDTLLKFKEHQQFIDILILDLIMPRKTGKEVYEEIRKTHPKIKVLFTSGYGYELVRQKGISEKEMNFVSKPISPSIFSQKIREVLDAA